MNYRRDIDGLRAFAVVPVVFYHAGLSLFGGGFVGVDVFFVISGFLITSLIAEQKDDDRFSFSVFYLRRIRRLAPALVPVGLFTSWLAWTYFLPQDFAQYMASLAGMLTYTANFVFLAQADYFAEASALKPLLHTWSLAVEEQFYLILPGLLVGLMAWRGRRFAMWALSSLGLLSLGLAVWVMSTGATEQAFYHSGLRFWELLAGSALALVKLPDLKPAASGLLRLVGTVLLFGSVFLYSDTTPFPGLAAVSPVLGTMLFLLAGADGRDPIHRLLQSGPVVYIGKVSYSLYLWHWPLIVAVAFVAPGNEVFVIGSVIAAFPIAMLSYHFVEQPFRSGTLLRTPRSGFIFLASISTLGLGAVAYTFLADSANRRFSGVAAEIAPFFDTDRAQATWIWQNEACAHRLPDMPRIRASCLTRDPARQGTILVIGDSHAQHLLHGIKARWSSANIIGLMSGGCKPIEGWTSDNDRCDAFRDYIFGEFADWEDIDAVVLTARQNQRTFEGLQRTAETLKTKGVKRLYLVGPMVEYDPSFDQIVAQNQNASRQQLSRLAQTYLKAGPLKLGETARAVLAGDPGFIDAQRKFCGRGRCRLFGEAGQPLILDYGHLTPEGSVWFINQWPDLLADVD